ncbi:MAG: methionine synthase [Sulfolobaceae archaeon]|nr:methionine synthase [Sulfolobaceae archaeon]
MEKELELPILPTTVIGSYPRPKWLREAIRLHKNGKISDEELKEAFDDAVIAVLRDHQVAGVDIPTDGEMRRDEMVEYFAERLKGFKFYGPVRVWGTAYYRKPSVVSKIEYTTPLIVDEFKFTKNASYSPHIKITITGPYTIAEWSYNEYYKTKQDLVFDLAKIINIELKKLVEAGATFIQVDEPALPTHAEEVEWAVDAINEAVKGINVKVGVHICYGDYSRVLPYTDKLLVDQFALEFANRNFEDLVLLKRFNFDKELGFGVVDVHNRRVESPEEVASAIRKALEYVPPDKLFINPDCGLKLLPRNIAFQKLVNMVAGTKIVREELKRKGYISTSLKPLVSR